MRQKYFTVDIAGLKRKLPFFKTDSNITICLFNILGDTEIVVNAANQLAKKLPKNLDVIITPEVKSIPLAFELSRITKLPYVVARKIKKPYMKGAISAKVISITTGQLQEIWLDGKDIALIKKKNVLILDDVVSTGSTINGIKQLIKNVGGNVVAIAAVFTEGNEKKWKDIISLGHLPIFVNK